MNRISFKCVVFSLAFHLFFCFTSCLLLAIDVSSLLLLLSFLLFFHSSFFLFAIKTLWNVSACLAFVDGMLMAVVVVVLVVVLVFVLVMPCLLLLFEYLQTTPARRPAT